MKTPIIKIGNSRGVRIPKPLLAQLGPVSEVEISAQGDTLVIRPMAHPRQGWEAQFQAMAALGDDKPCDETPATRFDEEEWQW